jgi:hypothetical protein
MQSKNWKDCGRKATHYAPSHGGHYCTVHSVFVNGAEPIVVLNDNKSKKCGCSTIMKTSQADPGKYRICERPAGHTGRHKTTYHGRVKYWADTDWIREQCLRMFNLARTKRERDCARWLTSMVMSR